MALCLLPHSTAPSPSPQPEAWDEGLSDRLLAQPDGGCWGNNTTHRTSPACVHQWPQRGALAVGGAPCQRSWVRGRELFLQGGCGEISLKILLFKKNELRIAEMVWT